MNIILIEDEKPAADKLQKALQKINNKIHILAVLKSVQESVLWFSTNPAPDLIFMDIELTDGTSMSIFDAVSIPCPVIFTTAYDEYWQAAFEHNSIDYLLKPIREEKLESDLEKYEKLKKFFEKNNINYSVYPVKTEHFESSDIQFTLNNIDKEKCKRLAKAFEYLQKNCGVPNEKF